VNQKHLGISTQRTQYLKTYHNLGIRTLLFGDKGLRPVLKSMSSSLPASGEFNGDDVFMSKCLIQLKNRLLGSVLDLGQTKHFFPNFTS
jgi:hypothetical protein